MIFLHISSLLKQSPYCCDVERDFTYLEDLISDPDDLQASFLISLTFYVFNVEKKAGAHLFQNLGQFVYLVFDFVIKDRRSTSFLP